jgi:hypothetical protein
MMMHFDDISQKKKNKKMYERFKKKFFLNYPLLNFLEAKVFFC